MKGTDNPSIRRRGTGAGGLRRSAGLALVFLLGTALLGADRFIRLQDHEANLRDLGGLPAAGGSIRPGLVYRSAALCKLTDQDVATLENLRLHTVIDLRQPHEITKHTADNPALLRTVAQPLRLPLDAHGAVTADEYYQLVLRQHPAEVKRFFEVLADTNNLPVLFHCAHGKDRTGVMSALLLSCLGTPRKVITADYLASHGTGMVKPAWIEAAYAEVDAAGGIELFLDRCGVPAETRARVRANLIAPR
jgi:protein tyrosine/serine phosphatase